MCTKTSVKDDQLALRDVSDDGVFCATEALNLSQHALRPAGSVQGFDVQGGSNMTGTDLYVNKPHCAAAVRP